MPLPKDQAWFAAKKYGYGWGFPKRWQGWVAMLAWLTLVIAMLFTVARSHPGVMLVFTLVSSAAFVGLCYWKGEQAKWRWGEEDGEDVK